MQHHLLLTPETELLLLEFVDRKSSVGSRSRRAGILGPLHSWDRTLLRALKLEVKSVPVKKLKTIISFSLSLKSDILPVDRVNIKGRLQQGQRGGWSWSRTWPRPWWTKETQHFPSKSLLIPTSDYEKMILILGQIQVEQTDKLWLFERLITWGHTMHA